MSKLFTEKSKFDPSERAGDILDHILDDTSESVQQRKKNEVSIDEALKSQKVVQTKSSRAKSRVLFITRDATVFKPDSISQKNILQMSDVFDEVHVMVLHIGKRNTNSIRIAQNTWIYPTISTYFLTQPLAALSLAKRQLQFADGFRPDIVVTLDPFESGISGYFIAKKYKRVLQVHVTEDFFRDNFEKEDKLNKWRLRFAWFVIKRTVSIRTNTSMIQSRLREAYPKKTNINLLPKFFDIKNITLRAQKGGVEKKYPQFSFTILFVGALTHESTLFRAIDATRRLLVTPSIGFIVIGDGPAKAEFQERAKILGIDAQTIFIPKADDVVAHMLSADVLICTDTTSESDEVVVKSAASRLPMVIARTSLREDLFADGEDAFLCDPEDTLDFATKLMKFLNTNTLRTQFAKNAQDIVATRIEESPASYQQALRHSIEEAFLSEELPKAKKSKANTNKHTPLSTQPKSSNITKSIDGTVMKLPEN